MKAAACGNRRGRPLLIAISILAFCLVLTTAGRGLNSQSSLGQQDVLPQPAQQVSHSLGLVAATSQPSRRLLQSSYVATACMANSSSVSDDLIAAYASKLVGDNRLAVTAVRFTGACTAFGVATLSAPHTFARQFGGALVLSTGDAAAATGDANGPGLISTDLKQPGDATVGSYTYDAAVLELDISVAPQSSSGGSIGELVLSYMFASEEYGSSNPNPDVFSIAMKSNRSSAFTDVAVLPGGNTIPPPSAFSNNVPVPLFKNTGTQYRTAFNGFTQVVPSQGFPVQFGGSYTLRIAIADANNGLADSVLMLPVGGMKLLSMPVISTGGPYAVAPNSQLTLTAAKSKSANGAIMRYQWQIYPYDQPTAALVTAYGPTVSMAAPAVGQYNISLDIWDVQGGHAAESTALSVDTSNVLDWWSATPSFATPATVAVPKPTAVIAINGSAGSALVVNARSGSSVYLTVDASPSTDGKGSPLAYAWDVLQVEPTVSPVVLMLPYAQPPKFAYSFSPGVYLISLNVSGPGGIASAETLLTVNANHPPVASAGGPYTTAVGVPVVVSADKSIDPDDDPLMYSWVLYRSNVAIGNYTGSALNMKLNTAGTYTLKLTVNDDRGGSASTMTQITSYVAAPSPSPPAVFTTASYSPPPSATTTVIAAVPAPAPAGRATTYAPSVYVPTTSTATSTAVQAAPPPSPAPAMCLFANNGTRTWNSTLSAAAWRNLDLFSLTNTYWAPCTSTAASPISGSSAPQTSSTTAAAVATKAAIRSPQAFLTAAGSATQVYLDATGSSAATGRSLIAFSWVVKRKSDNAVVTQVDGLQTSVWLGPGVYALLLVVTDTAGQTATAAKDFSVGDVAQTLAIISSPSSFVDQPDAGLLDVALSAAGSKAGPGMSLVDYRWAVYRLPDNAQLATQQGPTATTSLPVGAYRVYLAVYDSGGGNATTSKDVLVGSRAASGATAVITWPPVLVQAAAASDITTVALDGSGSAAALSTGSISQYVWAVVSMPNKQPVANATGRLTTVGLPAGYYQVGLLVVDSQGNTAAARKNFAISGASAVGNNPPIVKSGLSFSGTSGSSIKITGVTDPDGDDVTITWALMNQATGSTIQGKTDTVSLTGVAAGNYLMLITANDGRGGETSGTAAVTVQAAAGSTAGSASPSLPSSTSSSSASRLPAPSPSPAPASGSTAAGAASIRKLPTVTLPQGAIMDLDAASFNILPSSAVLDAYVWELIRISNNQQVATVYDQLGHFVLSVVSTYTLKLTAYDTQGKAYTSTGSVSVVAAGSGASALSAVSISGECGPLSGKQYTSVTLSCPSLSVSGASAAPVYAWKVITPTGAIKTAQGKQPALVGLAPGHYRVELAIGVGGAPGNQNTAYYLVTYLKIAPQNKLLLSMPNPLCAGQAVSLTAPPLIQENDVEPVFSWEVLWVESQQLLGVQQVMRSESSIFGFTLRTGHYEIALNATMANGAVIQGFGNITARPCLKCNTSVVTVKYAKGKCAADNSLARQVLLSPIPDEMPIAWAGGTVTTPGQRKVAILAKSEIAGLSSTCSATVNFTDAEPPTVKLLRSNGMCITPPNANWICWQASQLVQLTDNCQAVASLSYMVQCGYGSTTGTCKVLPDGQACVKAVSAGQSLQLKVLAKDGYNNVAQAVVPVQVRAAGAAAVGCQVPTLSSPAAGTIR